MNSTQVKNININVCSIHKTSPNMIDFKGTKFIECKKCCEEAKEYVHNKLKEGKTFPEIYGYPSNKREYADGRRMPHIEAQGFGTTEDMIKRWNIRNK